MRVKHDWTSALAAILVVLTAGSAEAQRGAPPRDAAPAVQGTASISGRVLALEDGRPLRRALVNLSGRAAMTDEDGRYEFTDLAAGRLTLTATKTGYVTLSYGQRRPFEAPRPLDIAAGQRAEGVDFSLPRAGVLVVGVTDQSGEPAPGVAVNAWRSTFTEDDGRVLTRVGPSSYAQTDDRGVIRLYGLMPGEYYVTAENPLGPGVHLSGEKGFALVKTYYPGTPVESEAQRVTLAIGQEVHVTFPFTTARLATISGTIRSADGTPFVRPSVMLNQRYESGGGSSRAGTLLPDGRFVIANVVPGTYTVRAAEMTSVDGPSSEIPVTISGANVEGLVLVPRRPTGVLRGRIMFESGDPPAGLQPSAFPLAMFAADGRFVSSRNLPGSDWTFEITGLGEPHRIAPYQPPAPWTLKAVLHDGRDVTDSVIGVADGITVDNVQVVLTNRRTTLGGQVVDAQGRAVGDYTVVVFADDPTRWGLRSRHVAASRPDQNGRFTVSGLPPGQYRVAALEYLERNAERDPGLLARLRQQAALVTLAEEDPQTLTLPLMPS